jgi:hypothetical protein
MAVACGKPSFSTLIGPCETHKVQLTKGAVTSERVDETYQIDRLEVYASKLPCEPELNWIVDINGHRWVLEKAAYYGCQASMTLVSPRLSCPEVCEIWTTEDGQGCESLPDTVLVMPQVASFWSQLKSQEVTFNGITMFEDQFGVQLQCDARAALLGANSLLRRKGCFYEVVSVENVGVPTKLPYVIAQKLQGYNSLGDA